jgi:hypothetical protein
MSTWNRVDKELQSRRKDWKWLRAAMLEAEPDLKLSEQAVNHWQERGVPPKHHARIEKIMGMHSGWVNGDVPTMARNENFSTYANDLAYLFDQIPESETMARIKAFNACVEALEKFTPATASKGQ